VTGRYSCILVVKIVRSKWTFKWVVNPEVLQLYHARSADRLWELNRRSIFFCQFVLVSSPSWRSWPDFSLTSWQLQSFLTSAPSLTSGPTCPSYTVTALHLPFPDSYHDVTKYTPGRYVWWLRRLKWWLRRC
jgi:hypothetical protein